MVVVPIRQCFDIGNCVDLAESGKDNHNSLCKEIQLGLGVELLTMTTTATIPTMASTTMTRTIIAAGGAIVNGWS